ncbi:DUF481 domain-containing protein [Parvularcula bermudensis]|nr:DUF481 domain-containing protein [Parvularcula bermudensis]
MSCVVCMMMAMAGGLVVKHEPTNGWDGRIEFSASAASGNTETSVLGARFSAKRVFGRFKNSLDAGANYAKATTENADGEEVTSETQDNFFVQYRLDAQTGDRHFAYGRVRYEEDAFSGFDSRWFIGSGFGVEVIAKDNLSWNLLGGPGVRIVSVSETEGEPTEDDGTEVALFAASEVDWTIRDGVTFAQDADATLAEANTTLANEFTLTTALTDRLSTNVGFKLSYESEPPEGRESTDTLLRASIGYSF